MVCLLLADDPLRCKAVRGYYSARTSRSGNLQHICKAFRHSLTKHRKRLLMPANACQTVCLIRYIANLMPNAPQRLALRTLHDSTEILTDKMAEQERRLGLFGWLLFMSRPVRVSPTKISHPLDKDGIFLKKYTVFPRNLTSHRPSADGNATRGRR